MSTNVTEIMLWEPIPVAGFSAYEWSECLGRVRSWRVKGPDASNRASRPQELVGNLNSEGRRRWKLVGDSGEHKDILLQELVCTKYYGPRPIGMQVCHYDGDVSNNQSHNLRWDTAKGNMADRRRHGNDIFGQGEKNLKAKLSPEAVLHIRSNSGSATSTLAREFGVSLGTVRDVRKRVTWKHYIKETSNAQC